MFANILDWENLPHDLIDCNLENILKLEDCTPFFEYQNFRQHKIKDKNLLEIIQKNFSFNIYDNTYYQVIKNELPIHIDLRDFAYNYILCTGGQNVYTVWYDDHKETEIFKIKLPKYKWHRLDVSKPHTVTGLESIRIAITVFK